MHILMLETRRGSEDGFLVRRFYRGERYDVAAMLAHAFIRAGWAIECQEYDPPAGMTTKGLTPCTRLHTQTDC